MAPAAAHLMNRQGEVATARPAMIGIIYAVAGVLGVFFICTIAGTYWNFYKHPERYAPHRGDGERATQTRTQGIARAMLDTIPVVKFRESTKSTMSEMFTTDSKSCRIDDTTNGNMSQTADENNTKETCSICTDEFEAEDEVRVLPCHHTFHKPCIDVWLVERSGLCPLCRAGLEIVDSNPPDKQPISRCEEWQSQASIASACTPR